MNGLAYESATIGLVLMIAAAMLASVKLTLWLADMSPPLRGRDDASSPWGAKLLPIRVRASRTR